MTWLTRATNPQRVYVVAELGSNYKSNENLFSAIREAKNAGADAVKYQYFDQSELYGPISTLKSDFPIAQLKRACDLADIDLLCSSFSPRGMRAIDDFVPAHKIASSEMSHIRLLETAIALGKPLILSTGGQGMREIARAVELLESHPTILLHCNHAYPANCVDLGKAKKIAKIFKGPMGFSDHTTNIDIVPMTFKNSGVVMYEKHFNPFDYFDTPDAPHSISSRDFKSMVTLLRGGDWPENAENEARLKHVRRIVAIKPILLGDRFVEGENIGIFRSKRPDDHGANPFHISLLENKKSLRAFGVGDGIGLSDAN